MTATSLAAVSPTFRRLRPRLAAYREEQLLAIASSAERPARPPPGACCGSSCDPCVLDVYREELKIWREAHPNEFQA
ncbi:hypothetical protein DFJ73DRAFT_864626 [Zopfochytrium polystomum]|nr:hypothetical protein DFJ73DRAFT_864626 [Zopfochytrium polystomum]